LSHFDALGLHRIVASRRGYPDDKWIEGRHSAKTLEDWR
jgi:hypothetical protein